MVVLPMLGPLFYPIVNPEGQPELAFYISESFYERSLPVAVLPVLGSGQWVRIENLANGERDEAPVGPEGCFRLAIPCDRGDPLRFEVRDSRLGPAVWTLEKLDRDLSWKGRSYTAGSPFVALESGHGARRQSPELRRFIQIAQTALDPGDPVNYAAYFQADELYRDFPGVHAPTALALVLSAGDMNVPISTGISLGRAAGLIGFGPGAEDPRYGKSPNDVLRDGWVMEGLDRLRRFQGPPWNDARPILLDPDDLSQGRDGFDAPRLEPPLRLGREAVSGALSLVRFIYPSPRGAHGILPSDPSMAYDIYLHVILAVGRYFQSDAREWPDDTCLGDGSCGFLPGGGTP
jgi:hypothetical protein